jgi:aminopeptidase YwaD
VDNTAGTAGLLGIAREIGRLSPQKTVRFATFGGEEEGLLGSYEYFKAYSSRLKGNLGMMLNMDMCNIDTKRSHDLPIVVSDAHYLPVLDGIKAEADRQLALMSGYDVQIYQGNLTSSSDMATFSIEHYKVASCWGSGSYEYHTTKDTSEHINPESFLVVGAVYGSFAYYLAGGKP